MEDRDNWEFDEYDDEQSLDSCPQCQRWYDEVDADFQTCSKCGWDANENKYKADLRREPSNADYMAGEADILTGEWY